MLQLGIPVAFDIKCEDKNEPTLGLELVSNGGMESGNPPTGWSVINSPDTFEQSGVKKHGGSYSAHVIDSSSPSYRGMASPAMSRIAGKKYKLSFWYYLADGGIEVDIRTGDNSDYLTTLSISSPATTWALYEYIFTETNTGSTGYLWFRNISGILPAEFYIDDVSVKELIQQ